MSDFLFADSSFLTGAGRVIDLCGVLERYGYNFSQTPGEADSRAIANDWAVVGGDMKAAVEKVTTRGFVR